MYPGKQEYPKIIQAVIISTGSASRDTTVLPGISHPGIANPGIED
jgi:hypothetical protein